MAKWSQDSIKINESKNYLVEIDGDEEKKPPTTIISDWSINEKSRRWRLVEKNGFLIVLKFDTIKLF